MDSSRASVYPFVPVPDSPMFEVARSEGAYLITPDGSRVLDAAGGAIVMNIGHGRAEVGEAFARAATNAAYLVPPFITEDRVRLVERLKSDWLPPGLTRAVFTSGGSESMDAAVRLARQHHVSAGRPSRWKVLGRDLAYHGTTLATLAIGGHTRRRAGMEPLLGDFPKVPACYCLRCPLGKRPEDCNVACADELETIIAREGADTIAAFAAEPIGGSTAGALVPPDPYWPRLVEICRRHGILIIADEVMTGFGRTGRRFAVDHWNFTPDILVGGKGLTGGYAPMGGIFATEEVMAPIAARGDDVMFYTYSAHPACCAAANTVLDIMERENLVERAAEMGRRLRERLRPLEAHPNVAEIRGRGLLIAIELVKDRATLEPFPEEARLTHKVVVAGLMDGAFFYPGGCDPARDVVNLGPPFIITDEDIEHLVGTLEKAIDNGVSWAAASAH